MFKRPKEPEKKGSEKREDLHVSFWKVARFVFAIIDYLILFMIMYSLISIIPYIIVTKIYSLISKRL